MKFGFHVIIAISCGLSVARAEGPALTATFTNPAASKDDLFGNAVAVLGNDRVVIGASGRTSSYTNPAVYLFTTNGQWLTTFTNPAPRDNTFFGQSVAAVGAEGVLIGTYQSGIQSSRERAFLFNPNGALMITFTNPPGTGGPSFGRSVGALGHDRLLIGAPFDYIPFGVREGLVHLFSTNGEWLSACTNPVPGSGSGFGFSVAAVGTSHVLVGAPYHASDQGIAYLFRTNGTLTTTFTNPTPRNSERFGSAVAAFGSDRVLIGAYWNDAPNGTRYVGTAYLFSTNGTLLSTLANPVQTFGGSFGGAVTPCGSDRFLVGAPAFALGATNAGKAYLFSIPFPLSVSIQVTVSNIMVVSWPSTANGFRLQQNTDGLSSVHWSNVDATVQDNGTNKFIIVNSPAGNRFYRLIKP